MQNADHFRKLAAQHRALAEKADPAARATLLRLVQAYEHEAERREANRPPPAPIR